MEIIEFLREISPFVIAIAVSVITRFVVPYLHSMEELNTVEERKALVEEKKKEFELRTEQIKEIKDFVFDTVRAAEKVYSKYNKTGEQKKEFVTEQVEGKIKEIGANANELGITKRDIEIWIESAVYGLDELTDIFIGEEEVKEE